MSKQKKRLVCHSTSVYSQYDTVDPQELIRRRDELIKTLPPELAKTVRFEIDSRYESYDPNTYYDLYMKWQDYETDKDFEKRLKSEADAKAALEKREREEFERLSKKFK